ncbi:MAG: LuxR C-terminal-related transcriptional regulator [candidate division Zixibacteria bacterium]|nr:LuxR C-terminal-related transcriptional regulator [candidate division Zixibacteria bacterium]
MKESGKSAYFEILVDKLIIESFPIERSLYHKFSRDRRKKYKIDKLRNKMIWHINHSLSKRQKEVIKLYLMNKKEAEIGQILGVKQQVVSIYKHRAINKLKGIITIPGVC